MKNLEKIAVKAAKKLTKKGETKFLAFVVKNFGKLTKSGASFRKLDKLHYLINEATASLGYCLEWYREYSHENEEGEYCVKCDTLYLNGRASDGMWYVDPIWSRWFTRTGETSWVLEEISSLIS